MKSAGGRRVVLAVVVGISAVAVPAVSPSQAYAAPETDTTVTGAPSSTVARVGEQVVVRGKVTGSSGGRDVQLQRLVGRSWRTVSSTTTEGTFTLTVPTKDDGISHYRVHAPAAGGRDAGSSDTFVVGVGEGDPDSHAFLTKPPARWNPCAPIGYRVNLDGAPEGALQDVRRAVTYASMASGVTFRYLGTTKVVPGAKSDDSLAPYPADTQLVVAYTTPAGSRHFTGRRDVLGVGGVFYDLTPQKIGRNTWYQAVQGYVVLNSTKDLPGGFGRGREYGELGTWGQVLMHEIGHTLGLDHPRGKDKAQIMYPETSYKDADWGVGDLVALRKIGAVAGCFPKADGPAAAGSSSAMEAGVRVPPSAGDDAANSSGAGRAVGIHIRRDA